jgi:rubrerythrin
MALIETAPQSSDCENNFRMACAAELEAINSYRDLRKQVYIREDFPVGIKEDLIRRLDEIIQDEENHFGSLLFCLNLINPTSMQHVDDGAKGA